MTQDAGFVMLRKNLRDRSSVWLDNDVRFAANNMLEYDILRENWKLMWIARFCMASNSWVCACVRA